MLHYFLMSLWLIVLYNMFYLFPVGQGFEVRAGLIDSYIGYESFLAIQNINYTRGYLLDFVPYFYSEPKHPILSAMHWMSLCLS